MTRAELIAGLAPSRLPQSMLEPGWHELLALFAIGLLSGLLLALALSPLMTRRMSRRARIRATRPLPPAERLLAIARILGYLPEALRPAAYGGAPMPDQDRIERIAGRRR